jgi:hypothetical protein
MSVEKMSRHSYKGLPESKTLAGIDEERKKFHQTVSRLTNELWPWAEKTSPSTSFTEERKWR